MSSHPRVRHLDQARAYGNFHAHKTAVVLVVVRHGYGTEHRHGRHVSGDVAHLRQLAEQPEGDGVAAGFRCWAHPASSAGNSAFTSAPLHEFDPTHHKITRMQHVQFLQYCIKLLTYIAGDLMIATTDGPLSSPGSNPAAAEVRRPCCPCQSKTDASGD